MSDNLIRPTESDLRRLRKWQAHLETRGTGVPDEEDFQSFGCLSTLERLRDVLSVEAPHHCAPLARVISQLKREKRQREKPRQTTTSRPSKGSDLSVGTDELPDDWKVTLKEMRRRRNDLDGGMIDLGDTSPPAQSQIRAAEYVLRCIVQVCIDADRSADLDTESVRLWLERQEARGQGEIGLAMQLRKLAEFLVYRDEKSKLRKAIRGEASRYARIGRLKRKRKHAWLLANPTDIGKVWSLAEELLAESRATKAGTSRRYLLALHASALALAVAAPLRISDLYRFRIDEEIRRDATGWSISIKTQKTGGDYERSELWPELTEFLDELLVLDAPGGDLWLGYDRRSGTPLFSRDGGVTALTADWISDVWYEHVGTGEHIVRTLWHQLAYDSDVDRTWMALSLCGQRGGGRTASQYHDRNQRARAVRAGRRSLSELRQAAMNGQQQS
ncbi:hypothetical protein [Pontivivens nitratireducens]|uniref:hypothetical protein n=1 Tax=Pontivivens nitratireducens TaxID=2758038 RepID=UPI001639D3A4|nr:hypothetical protein [Pontibrevibacter nitratireducens]